MDRDTRRQEDTLVRARFGANVRALRTSRGLSQERLAHDAGLDRTYVARIETGKRNPSLTNLVRLARGLGVTTAQMLEGIDE